jgi:hypothetical protein
MTLSIVPCRGDCLSRRGARPTVSTRDPARHQPAMRAARFNKTDQPVTVINLLRSVMPDFSA